MCDSRQISWANLAPQRRDNWLHLTMRLYEEASQELALAKLTTGVSRRLKVGIKWFTVVGGPRKSFEIASALRFYLIRSSKHAGVECGRNSGNTCHRPR